VAPQADPASLKTVFEARRPEAFARAQSPPGRHFAGLPQIKIKKSLQAVVSRIVNLAYYINL